MLKLRYEKCISSHIFKEPTRMIDEKYLLIDKYMKKLENDIYMKTQKEKEKYVKIVAQLDTLSPLKTLTRGYSIVEQNNKIIKSIKQLKTDDMINIKLMDGTKNAKIL